MYNQSNSYNKPQLYSDYIEKAALAACIHNGDNSIVQYYVSQGITVDSFFLKFHKQIYACCLKLCEDGAVVNEVTVFNAIAGENNRDHLRSVFDDILNSVEGYIGYDYYARKLKELEIARNMVKCFFRSVKAIREKPDVVHTTLEQTINKINDELNYTHINDTIHISSCIDNCINCEQGSGVLSGFKDIDNLTDGFRPGELIVIASRPSCGKTSLALNMLLNCNLPALYVSNIESPNELVRKMVTIHASIDVRNLKPGDEEVISKSVENIKKRDIFFLNDTINITFDKMRTVARIKKHNNSLGLIIIDNLHSFPPIYDYAVRSVQLDELCREFRGLAKELNIPVILLSQLNYPAVSGRLEPGLIDFRNACCVANYADLILLLSEGKFVYGGMEKSVNLIIAKNRRGPCCTIPLRFTPSTGKFASIL